MKTSRLFGILVLILCLIFSRPDVTKSAPIGTAFTYQGHLYDTNDIANGLYDFRFKLYDANCSGIQLADDVNKPDVDVIDAYFTVKLDFGSGVFDGNAVWLEIGVRPGEQNDPCEFTFLEPRQEITTALYALYACNAGDTTNFSGSLSGDVTGTQAQNKVVAIQGTPVSPTVPSVNQVLRYNGTHWEPSEKTDPLALHKYGEGNILIISPSDDLITKYNWLKSSERDSAMGVLSANNRRVLVLLPGLYLLSSTLTLDADYVDVISFSGIPTDTVIERNGGGYVIRQTAEAINLSGIKVYNSGVGTGDGAFNLNAANDNSLSTYRCMEFRITSEMPSAASVYGTSHIGGLWEFCKADGSFFKLASGRNLSGTFNFCEVSFGAFGSGGGEASDISGKFTYCKGGADSFGGGTLSGTFIHCTGGDRSFGGSTSSGKDCSGTFKYCMAGDNSFAMGKTFSGIAIGCTGGKECFGGYKGSGGDHPFFTGQARDCAATGRSFGGGSDSGECSGTLIGCRCTNMPTALRVAGAHIENCYLGVTAGGADREGILLKDDNTKIYNTTIICTGFSLKGGITPKNVMALHCRMNKDKHPNVTNLVGDGSLAAGHCIVDEHID